METKEKNEIKDTVKKELSAKIVEVTTQTSPAIQLEDGSFIDSLELQVLIYNKLCKIERSVA